MQGKISEKPLGANDYHWDTIFILGGENGTFAEMIFEEKQSYAVTKKLLERLKEIVK